MTITALSVKNHTTLFFIMAVVVITGTISFVTLPRESSPDISIPLILVYTPYPGASPEDVEHQVTRVLERELKGMDHLKDLRSTSAEGLSVVEVEFHSGTDLDTARQKVRDRVDLAKVDFSSDVEEPAINEINFSDWPVLQIHLSGEVGPVVLKTLAEELEDQLEVIPGVLRVTVIGALEREVKVDVDPQKLRNYGLSLSDVVQAIEQEHISIPGGELDLGNTSYAVRLPGEVEDPKQIENFVIKADFKRPVFIKDVARARYGFKDRTSYARINGAESVALSVTKRVGANIIDVADQVKFTVENAQKDWPQGVTATFMADQSKDIRTMVKDLQNNILSGIALVVCVLMFSLGIRQALFVGAAIPFSMFITFVVVDMSGMTLNMVVLFAMVLALGMLVDNAVVVIENIYRHAQEGTPIKEAAISATQEVGGAIFVSTLTTLGAFFPLLFWPGIVGDFMVYLPITVSIALTASLLVAFTFNPVLCSAFMRIAPQDKRRWTDRIGKWIISTYESHLTWALNHRVFVIISTILVFVGVMFMFGKWNHGIEFFPDTDPRQIFVDVELPSGTRLERTDEVLQQLERRTSNTSDLKTISATSGAGSQSDFGQSGAGDATQARLILDLLDREERKQSSRVTLAEVREVTKGIPGVILDIDRPEEGPPVGDPLSIEISGDDFATLGSIAERIKTEIESVEGLVSLDDDFDKARPELIVDLNRTEAARLGLSTAGVASTIRTAINGTEAAIFRDGEDEADITVRLAEPYRQSIKDLQSLNVYNEDGVAIPLGNVASIRQSSALTSIRHKDQKRVVTVSGKVTSPEMAEPVRVESQRRIEAMTDLLPRGYSLRFAGQQEDEEEAKAFLSRAFLFGVLLVLTFMISKFNSFAIPGIIITSVIMSMIGVLLGLLIVGLPFGIIMTGLGVISLAGIVVNNAIVLLVYAEQLKAQGLSRRQCVLQAGLRRMRPVLLTAITTLLGLVPLTTGVEFDFIDFRFSTGGESSQWWQSMGVSVMFGLAFATFLTLILVPVMYDMYLHFREWMGPDKADRTLIHQKPQADAQQPDDLDDPAIPESGAESIPNDDSAKPSGERGPT